MSRREQILSLVGVVAVILVGFYYILYQPRKAEYDSLVAQRDARQARVAEMERIAEQTAQLERQYQDLLTFIATLEAKLPTEKEIPALLVQMERQTISLHVDLRSLRPGGLEAVTAGQAQPQTQPQPQTQGGGTGQQQAAQARPEYYRLPVALSVEATFNEYVSLLRALRNFPRLIAVTRVSMTPGAKLPKLNVTVDTETYVLPKEAR